MTAIAWTPAPPEAASVGALTASADIRRAAPPGRAVIFLLAARDDIHGVVGNGPLQLEGLTRRHRAVGRLTARAHNARYALVADPPHSLRGLSCARKGLDA
jgi:hypothetical protein